MKLNGKALTLLLSAGIIFSLSGCGGGGTTTATEITYTGTDRSTRTAALTPGDAEVLADEGYQHTLFDTAEKKCQHCHNELFDSWKTSMHSKSWSDKIFQTKQQDFLRTHIAKIGLQKDANYTTETFTKVGKTCAKCHAPAAIYSKDFNLTIKEITDREFAELNTTQWASLKSELESNIASDADYSPHEPTTVVSISNDQKLYTATYHIGNANNREGINCATCHSIETVRMMTNETYTKDGVDGTGGDGGTYTLAADIRGNVIGPVVQEKINPLGYSPDASDRDMNIYFKLVGPEKYSDVSNSPHETNEYDVNKSNDGRYTFRGIDKDGTDGKTHYTGGPFYGPFGVTGLDNSNEDDDTNRSAQVNPYYDKYENNHFGNNGKGLCLSCHQRSAGAIVPTGDDQGQFMELCTTWTAVSNGDGTNYNDISESPKCQKCHMARINEDYVLHQWAKPTTHFTQEFMAENGKTALTPHFDPDNTDPIDNPVRDKWMNDHAFAGGNVGGTGNAIAKFKSGFDANVTATAQGGGNSIQVTTRLQNKTAHMFPAAHPMRRLLTRVIVTDEAGIEQNVTAATGLQDYMTITNDVVTGDADNTISAFGEDQVEVIYNSNRIITYQGKADAINGPVLPQEFKTKADGIKPTLSAPDGTVKFQEVKNYVIQGKVFNAAIVDIPLNSRFTRIYGRETGKIYPDIGFVVRPGFDSAIVPDQRDNRLQPNEYEEYTINYGGLADGTYTVKFKVYYLLKGANGQFPTGDDGFLKPAAEMTDIELSHKVKEVYSSPDIQVTVGNI